MPYATRRGLLITTGLTIATTGAAEPWIVPQAGDATEDFVRAMQSANSARSDSSVGAAIFLPKGTYHIHELPWDGLTSFVGEEVGSTILKYNGKGGHGSHLIGLNKTDGAVPFAGFYNMTIDGFNGTPGATAVAEHGCFLRSDIDWGWKHENVQYVNCFGDAIRIEGAGENALEDLWFANYLTFHPVTEGDIRSDYDRQLKSGEVVQSVEEYKLSQIVVASEKEALEILDRLKCGAVFGNLAREKSLDLESALMEGVVGWVPPSQLASPIDQLVAALSVGQMSRPIQTQQGWLIVKVDDIKFLPAKSFEEMRQEISQRILRDRRREAVAGLLASTSIVKAQQHPSVHAAAAKKDMAPH